MKVVFLPEVEKYLFNLAEILYQKGYFGLKENAVRYVTDLIQDIILNIRHKQKRLAPRYFSKYGKCMHYAVFRKSRNTQWYTFFNMYQKNGETVYLIRFISNNHSSAQFMKD